LARYPINYSPFTSHLSAFLSDHSNEQVGYAWPAHFAERGELVTIDMIEQQDAASRDTAHGRQRIAFFEYAAENHGDDTIAKLAVNRLTVVPLMHPVFYWVPYSVILNYNTQSRASSLFLLARRSACYFSSLKINGGSQIVQEFVREEAHFLLAL
jgi:hypothetical protein